jgi:hypothetical protein
MVVFAVLFSVFQCLAMTICFAAISNNPPDLWLSIALIWLGILFGPAIYLFADNESNRPVINLTVVVFFVIAIVLGLTSGRFSLFPYHHQILSMGAIVSGLAIAVYNFPWPSGSKIKHRVLLGILALGPRSAPQFGLHCSVVRSWLFMPLRRQMDNLIAPWPTGPG